MATRKIEVAIVGDSKVLDRAFRKAGHSADSFGDKVGRGFARVGKGALILGAVAGVGLAAALKVGTGELLEQERVSAQTAAALRSTGNAAKVTVPQIEAMSGALQSQTGLQDDVIQSGANMLLTFTNVQNRAGKGNDIFNQSTVALADMSVALGKSMPKAAVQLGKALNDPVKGITALSKAGVMFTDDQKATIKSLVETGDVMGAQKIILAELNKEFGGSAKAFGGTTKGKIERIKRAFEEVSESLALNLLPALTVVLGWIASEGIPLFERFGNWAIPLIRSAIDKVRSAFEKLAPKIKDVVGWLRRNTDVVKAAGVGLGVFVAALTGVLIVTKVTAAFKVLNATFIASPIGLVVVAVALLAAGLYLLYTRSETARRIMDAAFKGIKAAGIAAFNYLKTNVFPTFVIAFQRIVTVVRAVVTVVTALWRIFGADIVRFAKVYFGAIVGVIKPVLKTIEGVFKLFGAIIRGDWSGAWSAVKQILSGALGSIKASITGAISVHLALARLVGTAIVKGIFAGLKGLASLFGKLWGLVSGALGSLLSSAVSAARNIGVAIVRGIGEGIASMAGWLADKAWGVAKGALDYAAKRLHINSPSLVASKMLGEPISEGIAHGIQKASGKTKRALSAVVQGAIKDAKANLTSLSGGLASSIAQGLDSRASAKMKALDSSPEAKALKAIQDGQATTAAIREKARLDLAVGDAKTDAEKKEAQDALNDFLLQQEADRLSASLDASRTAIQDESDTRKTAVDKGLADLTDSFNRGLISQREFNSQLANLLASNDVNFGSIGSDLGSAFVNGFTDQLAALNTQLALLAGGPQSKSGLTGPDVVDPYAVQLKEWQDRKKVLEKARGDAISDSTKSTSPLKDKVSKAEQDRIDLATSKLNAHNRARPVRALAFGGIVDRPTFGVFGEAGAEAFIPLGAGKRERGIGLLNEAAKRLGVGNSNGGPIVNIERMVVSDSGDVDRFAARIGRQLAMRAA